MDDVIARTLSGRRVLITGASGFIGYHLAQRLIAIGAEAHGISREPASSRSIDGLHWHQGDVADDVFLGQVFETARPEFIVHLASEVTGSRDLQVVPVTLRSNLISTVNLLNLVTRHGCQRLVLAGSLEEPTDGSAPSSPYGASKAAASLYARTFFNLYQTPVVTARLFMVYGPAQRDMSKIVPYVTTALLRGERPKLSSGVRPVDWIYVDDVVDGLLRCAVTQGVEGRTIDLGSGQLVTIRAMVETLAEIVAPGAALGFGALPDRPFEQVRAADAAESLALIGWQPQVALAEGLRRTAEYYRAQL